MESKKPLRNPLVVLMAILLVIGVISLGLVNAFTDDQVEITLRSSPAEVDLTVDGEDQGRVASGESIEVATSSDTVELTASEAGYEAYQGTVEVDPEEEALAEFVLYPETDEAEEEAAEQEDRTFQQRMTEQYLEEAEEAYEDHPILNDLPQVQDQFRAYQGMTETEGEDFAIHLYLYEGEEAAGREAYTQWMNEAGHNPDDYEVVEHVEPRDNSSPDPVVEEPPELEDIEQMSPQPVDEIEVSADGLDAAQLAQHFAVVGTSWQPAEDEIPSASMQRATPLMTQERADQVQAPENPITTGAWNSAAENETTSYPWVADAVSNGDGSYTVDVCWAWLTTDEAEGDEPTFEGPRTYEIDTVEEEDQYRVSGYRYSDPDPFVEPDGECAPED